MKKMKLFCGILVVLAIFTSCSNNDSNNSNLTNGFTVNGNFYSTNYAKARRSDPFQFVISNPLNHNAEEGLFGSFYLRPGTQGDGVTTLIEGTYSTSNGPNSYFGIDDSSIRFQDNSEEGSFAYSAYWDQDDDFQSGSVTINSITSNSDGLNEQITEIDLDYEFRWNEVIIIGNYSGAVEPFQ